MKTIGLIGGMSFEATAIYYRRINETVRERLGGLHSAELILHSVDFQPFAELQQKDGWAEATERVIAIAGTLQAAGADCLLICANTMHVIADAVEASVRIPLVHIVDETARHLHARGCRAPLLLGTRYTMEQGFYVERLRRHGFEPQVPDSAGREDTHRIIFEELCAGRILDASRGRLLDIITAGIARGADSVILGCTELGLILDPDALPVPGFDTTVIHAGAAVDFALRG